MTPHTSRWIRPLLAACLLGSGGAAMAQGDNAGTSAPGGSNQPASPSSRNADATSDPATPGSSRSMGTGTGMAGMGAMWNGPGTGEQWSLLPWTRRGYVGANLGRPKYDLACGAGFGCDDPNLMGKVYTGGLFNEWLGAEIGYLHMGQADRGGGRTRADGLNLSVVGRMPFGQQFNAFAKLGATYGRTRVSANPASGLATGRESGWGPSYGVGVGWDFMPNSGVVLEWERHDFHFVGTGREAVDAWSVGYVYRF